MTPPRERAPIAYRSLLRLLPAAFRATWGTGMEELFLHRLEQARGRAGRAWVWVRAIGDVLWLAMLERRPGRRAGADSRTGGDGMMQDLRHAVRSLAAAPLFTAGAVGTLALGIGATVATFSVVWAVLLKPLPYQEPDRLVAVWPSLNYNAAMVRETKAALPALEGITGLSMWTFTSTEGGEPRELDAMLVTPNHFDVLGVGPALGRGFRPEEALPGAGGVVVLSHGFWMNALGGDPDIIGKMLRISGAEHDVREVVGVMPAGYRPVKSSPDLWVPLEADPSASLGDDNTWYVNWRIGRLAPGASLEQASDQLRAFATRAQAAVPGIIDESDVLEATIEPLRSYTAGDVSTPLRVALGAVGLVLLIACANAANLLLARGERRAPAFAVRVALGAGQERILRLVLLESLVVGGTAGVMGIALSHGLLAILVAQAPADFPRLDEIAVRGPVLMFALVAALVSTLLAGTWPALRASRVDGTATLGRSARASSARKTGRLTPALVAVQVALAVIVTVGSGLMLRSLDRLLSEDPGLEPAGVLTFGASPGEDRYPDGPAFVSFYDRLLDELRALPGVTSASAIHLLPGTRNNWSFPTFVEGTEIPEGASVPSVNFRAVYPDYFRTVGIPVLAGRPIDATDGADTEPVVVVNRAFADRFFPGQDPLGRSVRVFSRTARPYRIVGVVGDVRQFGLGNAPVPELYYAPDQWTWQISQRLVVRWADGAPMEHAAAVRAAVRAVDPLVPVTDVQSLDSVLGDSARTTRFLTVLLSAFGALAVLLGAVGVFGVTAYSVGRRVPEFGVRLALGSTRGAVVRTALGGTLGPVVTGLVVGLVGAWGATRVLAAALYGIEPTDLPTFVAVPTVLLAVGAVAALVPAWRAGRIDPVTVLNAD